MTQDEPRHTNRLAAATSPYLLQHAHNPVDWYPWGEEALARARAENKPILLSIGYSACHWCHVMERESFENEPIAALMNDHFVCIKVDREERPDLDDIYMAATLAMNQGQGGWPMTVFLTPDQHPFFAGTYFPPEDRYGRPGFPSLLARIAEIWAADEQGLRQQGAQLVQHLQDGARVAPAMSVGAVELRKAVEQYRRDFDPRWGGFSPAPKFPPSSGLSLLLRAQRRFGDDAILPMVRKTLDAMARGGLYDHVGGGFSRYSVDERWLVPHFEKMLYDNAQLARAYLEGFQVSGDPFYQRVATDTLDYVLREMQSPEGGFYSATDADSEGVEGKFFVWTPDEVRAATGDDEEARRFCEYYDITERGNWEGHSIPNTPASLSDAAARLGVTPAELEISLAVARPKVYKARLARVKPGLDDKVLTAWNGLMIGALAEGARVLGDPRYLQAAEKAAQFVLSTLRTADGRLLRTWRAGKAHIPAFLEDYAAFTGALVDLYEAGGPAPLLDEATALAELMREDFGSTEGGFFSTARDHESLIVRPREGHDGATPAANAMAALALARLSFHQDREDFREDAVRAIRAYGRMIQRQPRAFATTLLAVDLLLDGPIELALVGTAGAPDLEALRQELGRHFLPNRIVAMHDPATGEAGTPLLRGKSLVQGRAALYVCRNFTCQRPVTEVAAVAAALASDPDAAPLPNALAGARMAGAATPEATAAYATRHGLPASAYTTLGATGLVTSRLGFGGYRTDDESAAHHAALRHAFQQGINLVDTSTNYMDGGSERLVGEVLREGVEEGYLRREEVVVVSKAGYVQGENLEHAREREEAGEPYPEMVKYAEGVWHCIHPAFLSDQIARSLDRLQLATLDVCLLHNPEYFLSDGHERSHGTLASRREEFARRVAAAFQFLETEVQQGRLRWYGISSNMAALPAGDPEAISLDAMLAAALATSAGKDHHFRVLQMPMNLFEAGALLERNSGPDGEQTVLETADRAGVGVLVNRPLNAMVHESLLRLAEVEVGPEGAPLDAQLTRVEELEAEYRRDIAAHLEASEGGVPPEHFFRWSADLRGAGAHIGGIERWQALEEQRIRPRLLQALRALDESLQGEMGQTWQEWRARYVPELQALLAAYRYRAAVESRDIRARVSAALDPLLPVERQREPLARKALWVLASTAGVASVLNGMRTPQYVDDARSVLSWPPHPDAPGAFRAVGEASPVERGTS